MRWVFYRQRRYVAVAYFVSLQLKLAEMMNETRNVEMKGKGRDKRRERSVRS